MRMIYLGNNCNCIWNLYCFFVKFKRYKYMIFFTFCFLLSLSHKYKMAQLVPFHWPTPQTFIWSLITALQLIRERKVLNTTFITNRNHTAAWNQVATNVFAATRFVCTSDQCCSKWNALKRGYENMKWILGNNSNSFPLQSPNNFDHTCFMEMSDQFWVPHSN